MKKSLPAETAERRADFVERVANPIQTAFVQNMIDNTRRVGDDLFPPDWDAQQVVEDMEVSAKVAELFTATDDMFDLMVDASHSLPPQKLDRFDLPAEYGWLHLPKPFVLNDVRGDRMPISDLMWGTRYLGHPGRSAGKNLDDTGYGVVIWAFVEMGGPNDPLRRMMVPAQFKMAMKHSPRASLMHVQTVAFGHESWSLVSGEENPSPEDVAAVREWGHMRDLGRMKSAHDGEVVEESPDGGYVVLTEDGDRIKVFPEPLVQFLKTYFHFVESELTMIDRPELPRSLRKILRRMEMPTGPVSVVKLRRHKYQHDSDSGWELTYRYVRRGHWRKQWYGSGENRYQKHIWIAATIVGPEDAPFRVRDVVNTVMR